MAEQIGTPPAAQTPRPEPVIGAATLGYLAAKRAIDLLKIEDSTPKEPEPKHRQKFEQKPIKGYTGYTPLPEHIVEKISAPYEFASTGGSRAYDLLKVPQPDNRTVDDRVADLANQSHFTPEELQEILAPTPPRTPVARRRPRRQ